MNEVISFHIYVTNILNVCILVGEQRRPTGPFEPGWSRHPRSQEGLESDARRLGQASMETNARRMG